MERLARRHQQSARKWYGSEIAVSRYTDGAWVDLPSVRGAIQYRYAFGSSNDPDVATENDAVVAILFVDPDADIRPADRLTVVKTGSVWGVTAVASDRTTAGTMPVSLAKPDVAVIGESVLFRRHLGSGVFEDVGTVLVQFTENPTEPVSGDTAGGLVLTGTMVSIDPAATLVIPGDYFGRDGATGIVQSVEYDAATGRAQMAYRLEDI